MPIGKTFMELNYIILKGNLINEFREQLDVTNASTYINLKVHKS